MATSLFIATGNGVFLSEPNGSGHEVRPAGLGGKGMVRWILADPSRPGRVWAATERTGVWRTDDGGRSWTEKNEGLVYKHTLSLALHPVSGALYAGTEPACIFRSTDGGDSWVELEALRRLRTRRDWTFPGPPHVAHVRGIGLSPCDPDVIFGAVEEGWVVRSRDGGETWVNIKDGTEFDSHTVTVLPDGSGTVIAASGKGLYRSTDGGETFTQSDAGISHPYLINVAVHPQRPRVLFTAGAEVSPPGWRRPEGARAGLYRSENGGESWTRLSGGLPERIGPAPRAISVDPADAETVFVGFDDGQIWATRNGGETFRRIAAGLPPVLGIAPVPA